MYQGSRHEQARLAWIGTSDHHRALMVPRLVAVGLVLLVAGCYASRDDAGGGPDAGCNEDVVARCALRDIWIFPTEACALDHTAALGLCPSSRAVLATPPIEYGGAHTRVEGTWAPAISPDLVAVQLPDASPSLAWDAQDDAMRWREPGPAYCIEPTGYRLGDERLTRPGWDANWARGLCEDD